MSTDEKPTVALPMGRFTGTATNTPPPQAADDEKENE
jgi:hypothetical protein